MKIKHQVVVFDAADLASESRFWAGVLDGTVDAEDDWHMVMVDGAPKIGVQLGHASLVLQRADRLLARAAGDRLLVHDRERALAAHVEKQQYPFLFAQVFEQPLCL
jgi:hypothetical protein